MGDLFHSIYFLTTQYFTSTFVTAAQIANTGYTVTIVVYTER